MVTLSDKWDSECGNIPEWRVYHEDDVKDFIKQITGPVVIPTNLTQSETITFIFDRIKELAGEKLI